MRALVFALLASVLPVLPAQFQDPQTRRCWCGMGLSMSDTLHPGWPLFWSLSVTGDCPYSVSADRVIVMLGSRRARTRLVWGRYRYCDVLVEPEIVLFLPTRPKQPRDYSQDVHGPYIPNSPDLVGLTFYSQMMAFKGWQILGLTNTWKCQIVKPD